MSVCKCGHVSGFHDVLDNWACHEMECDCLGWDEREEDEGEIE